MDAQRRAEFEAILRSLPLRPSCRDDELQIEVDKLVIITPGMSGRPKNNPAFSFLGPTGTIKELRKLARLAAQTTDPSALMRHAHTLHAPAVDALANQRVMRHDIPHIPREHLQECIGDAITDQFKMEKTAYRTGRPPNNFATGLGRILYGMYVRLTGTNPKLPTEWRDEKSNDPTKNFPRGLYFNFVKSVLEMAGIDADPVYVASESILTIRKRAADLHTNS